MWPTIRLPILLILALFAVLLLSGCTDEHQRKAAEAVQTGQAWVDRAVAAEAMASDALAQVEAMAAQLDSATATALIAQAKAVLADTRTGVALAQDGLAAAKVAQEAAAAAHASGGGTMATVGTGVLSFLIGLLALYPKTRAAGLALQQIVGGVQAVRKKMNPGEWKTTVAPALAATTDDATKRKIDHILAQLPKAAG